MKLIKVLLVCGCMMFALMAVADDAAAQADYTITVAGTSAPIPFAPGCTPVDTWDFGLLPDFGIEGFDGPLTSVGGGPILPGFLPDNIIIDSQIDGPGGVGRGVDGTGLVAVGPSAGFGNPVNAVLANFFNDAYGIDFGQETCQFTFTATSVLGGPTYDLYIDGVLQFSGLISGQAYTVSGPPWFEFWIHDPAGGGEGLQGEALVSYELEIQVAIDIRPTSCPNPFMVGSKGVIPLAILGTADFDVTQIDPASVRLAGIEPLRWANEDVSTPFEPYIGKQDAFVSLLG